MGNILFVNSRKYKEIVSNRTEGDIILQICTEEKLDDAIRDLNDDSEINKSSISRIVANIIPGIIIGEEMEAGINRLRYSTQNNRVYNLKLLLTEIVKAWEKELEKEIEVTFSNRESAKKLEEKIVSNDNLLTAIIDDIGVEIISPYLTYEELPLLSKGIPFTMKTIGLFKEMEIEILLKIEDQELKISNLSYFDSTTIKSIRVRHDLTFFTLRFPQERRDLVNDLIQGQEAVQEHITTFGSSTVIVENSGVKKFRSELRNYIENAEENISQIVVIGKTDEIMETIHGIGYKQIQMHSSGMSIVAERSDIKRIYGNLKGLEYRKHFAKVVQIEELLRYGETCTLISGREPKYFPTKFSYKNGVIIINPPLIFFDDFKSLVKGNRGSIFILDEEKSIKLMGDISLSDDEINRVRPEEKDIVNFAFYVKRLTIKMRINKIILSDGIQEEVFTN